MLESAPLFRLILYWKRVRLDTARSARILSTRRSFWNSAEIRAKGQRGFRVRHPEEGHVEQEADGSWVSGLDASAGLNRSPIRGSRTFLPEPVPGDLYGLGQAKSIPGDYDCRGARFKCRYACALNGGAGSRPGASKG